MKAPEHFKTISLYGKGTVKEQAGVGVLVASELADRIIRVERISDRVTCC